jgi:glucose-6-phosphate 1-epimerase
MAEIDLEGLNGTFGIPGVLTFRTGPGGLVVAEVENPHATASVALQGAQVLAFAPRGQVPVIWTGPAERVVAGKNVRGGVPICWPWFGPHATDPKCPGHGVVRVARWDVLLAEACTDGSTHVLFGLAEGPVPHPCWPHRARLELAVTVGASLAIELATTNLGEADAVVGEALHTYFQVSDIEAVAVRGLEGCAYLDKVGGGRRVQEGPVTIAGEVDRVYLGTEAECVIADPGLARRIVIGKRGSRSTVVWNPWAAKAEAMGDLGPDGWRNMLCVESANAAEDVVTVAPGATHRLAVDYRVEPL